MLYNLEKNKVYNDFFKEVLDYNKSEEINYVIKYL